MRHLFGKKDRIYRVNVDDKDMFFDTLEDRMRFYDLNSKGNEGLTEEEYMEYKSLLEMSDRIENARFKT